MTGRSAPPVPWTAVGTTRHKASVYGVHGAQGKTYWKAFATRRQLRSESEAVEWASLPVGAVSGEHRHTRTEEIYLVLSGSGDLLLNGREHPVRAGSLALTSVGNVHGLHNTGDTPLDWWVIETLAPATTAVLAGAQPPTGADMTKAVVHDLFEERTVDTAGVFSGPLKRVELVELPPGEKRVLGRDDAELALFVHEGEGVVSAEGVTEVVRLAAGTCLLLSAGSRTEFTAGTPLRLAVVTLAVAREGGPE
ncbi:cupin domain-containing protein [Streptomyces sp. NBC_01294]|uniref:cupin domain-containing protein n=1 Tax=Streptomyces sp. NBC_01294 TaxID=2903815 RepID=UPI002DD7A4AB|nr:cupin domain-containing protein [Streptomyces sp. NBC_01294]WRZ56508.1 cupin domain-containing protein [Streptomyces sp. NBC_01294]